MRTLFALLIMASSALAQGMGAPQGPQPPDTRTTYERAWQGCFHANPHWSGRQHDAWLDRCVDRAARAAIKRSQTAPWVDRAVDFNNIGTDAAKAMGRCGPYGAVTPGYC